MKMKTSKTDPFRAGCFIDIGLGRHPLCAAQAMMKYLAIRGDSPGPLFLCKDSQPLSWSLLGHPTRGQWPQMLVSGGL